MPVDEAFDARLHDCDPEEQRDKNKGECDGDGRLMAHRSFTLRAFREEAHVAILSSTSYPMVKSALNRQHVERRIVLELPGFLVLAAIVSSTDLVATVPRTIGETLAATGSVRVFPCPVKIPNFSVKQ